MAACSWNDSDQSPSEETTRFHCSATDPEAGSGAGRWESVNEILLPLFGFAINMTVCLHPAVPKASYRNLCLESHRDSFSWVWTATPT